MHLGWVMQWPNCTARIHMLSKMSKLFNVLITFFYFMSTTKTTYLLDTRQDNTSYSISCISRNLINYWITISLFFSEYRVDILFTHTLVLYELYQHHVIIAHTYVINFCLALLNTNIQYTHFCFTIALSSTLKFPLFAHRSSTLFITQMHCHMAAP